MQTHNDDNNNETYLSRSGSKRQKDWKNREFDYLHIIVFVVLPLMLIYIKIVIN